MKIEKIITSSGEFYLCVEQTHEGLLLLSVHGTAPILHIPEVTPAGPITALERYCFHDKNRGTPVDIPGVRPLTGDNIEEIYLPPCVGEIGEYAFYNCRRLRLLEAGPSLRNIHSDVFMNCGGLREIKIESRPDESTGLQNILSRIKNALEVSFTQNGQEELRLFYPEYSMNYEPVFAAHLFQMRINGGGYGPRQAFREDILDIQAYDEAAIKALPAEDEHSGALMCIFRLLYPTGLEAKSRAAYEAGLKRYEREAVLLLTHREDALYLKRLIKKGLIGRDGLKTAVSYAQLKGKREFIRKLTL